MQPTPGVTPADVERVVRRDFPAERVDEVLAMLAEYGPEEWHIEVDRVRLATLKLAAGDPGALRTHIEVAKRDWRDVLLEAEYPGYAKKMFRIDRLPPEERQRIIDADWKQYVEWMTRER